MKKKLELTKLEHFAVLAMQSLLINPPFGHIDGTGDELDICKLSIKYADELLKQLESHTGADFIKPVCVHPYKEVVCTQGGHKCTKCNEFIEW
jgi:hypothetical protein